MLSKLQIEFMRDYAGDLYMAGVSYENAIKELTEEEAKIVKEVFDWWNDVKAVRA